MMHEEQLSLTLLLIMLLGGVRALPFVGEFAAMTLACFCTLFCSAAGSGAGAMGGIVTGTALSLSGPHPFIGASLSLCGVLAGEMKNDWPMEALKAQAILARTFVIKFLSEKQSKYENADISTDVEEAQAYNAEAVNDSIGIGAEDSVLRTAHAKVGDITRTVGQNLLVSSRDVSVSAENGGHSAVKIKSHCSFFSGCLCVEIKNLDSSNSRTNKSFSCKASNSTNASIPISAGVTERMSPMRYLLYLVKLPPPRVATKMPRATALLEKTPMRVSAA